MNLLFKGSDVMEFILFIICLVSALSPSYSSRLQCFMGNVSTTEKATVHLVNCTTPATVRPITTCLLFKYQTDADGSQDDTRLKYGGIGTDQFACDEVHLCERSKQMDNSWIRNVTYNHRIGDLYCCNTPKCNHPRGAKLAQTSIACFVGETKGDHISGAVQPCATQQCFNMTHGDITEHMCDIENLCYKHQVGNNCKKITDGDVLKLLCCCDNGLNGCNANRKPITPSTPSYSRIVAAPAHITNDKAKVQPMQPMPPGVGPRDPEEKSRVAGIVSAAILGIALVVLVIVIGYKQWRRYREKYNFSYMQLTADMMVL